MRSPSTTGGVGRLNVGAARRAARSKVVVPLGAREPRAQPPRAAELALVTFLHRLLEEATAHTGLGRLLASIVQGAAHLCGVRMVAINLLREDRQELEVVSVYGAPGAIHGTRLPVAASLSGTVITSGRTLRCGDVRRLRDNPRAAFSRRNDVRGLCIVPLRGPEGPIGTLAAAKKGCWQCTGDQEIVLKLLAHVASVAVQLARPRAAAPPLLGLAGKERAIARLLIADKTHKEIAEATGLSPRTVGHYIERLKLRRSVSTMHGLVGSLLVHAP
ncbi:MAG: GAF domain-containing protein [Deltaproteobacteria bacterium]|nr:MAG: GAF domain-containing protein [Deltaproteobacteria bacterium]